MKKQRNLRIFSLFLILSLLLAPSVRADFSVNATAAIVMEVKSGQILYQQDADITVYPASLTKIMTALVAAELCPLDEMITVHGAVLEGLHPDSTTANLVDGEQLTLRQLLYCMFLVSANDASCVVAEHVGGTVERFVEMMNDKAAALGCTGTHFANPHGLHEEDHYTTARDLLRIAEAFYLNDTLMDISSTERYTIAATSHNNPHDLFSIIYTNSPNIAPVYYYEGCRGIKTGSTSAAGKCLIVTCEREELEVIAVVTGCPTTVSHNGGDWAGHYAAMHDLLDYTYANFDMAILREVYADDIAARAEMLATPPVLPTEPYTPPETPENPDEPENPTEPDTSDTLITEPDELDEPVSQPPVAVLDTPDADPAPETAPPAEPDAKAAPLPMYAWLLIGIAGLMAVYTAIYVVQNLTRPMRRKRRRVLTDPPADDLAEDDPTDER